MSCTVRQALFSDALQNGREHVKLLHDGKRDIQMWFAFFSYASCGYSQVKRDRECHAASFESHRNAIVDATDAHSGELSYKLFGFPVCAKAYAWLYAIPKSTLHRIQQDARSDRKL